MSRSSSAPINQCLNRTPALWRERVTQRPRQPSGGREKREAYKHPAWIEGKPFFRESGYILDCLTVIMP